MGHFKSEEVMGHEKIDTAENYVNFSITTIALRPMSTAVVLSVGIHGLVGKGAQIYS